MTQVRIADLLASSPVDPTAHLDPDRVRHYAELPGDPPPVVAFRTEQGLILADGYHRVAAAQARGLDSIEAEIRHGSAHDALRYAVTIGSDPAVSGATTSLLGPALPLPRRLRQLANETGGRPERASPTGRAGGHRRQASSYVVLAGRAPDVPYASVGSGRCTCCRPSAY
jgi:hypothetical protein